MIEAQRISERRGTAALPHPCIICGQTIMPGQTYMRLVYKRLDALKGENAFRMVKFHAECPKEPYDAE